MIKTVKLDKKRSSIETSKLGLSQGKDEKRKRLCVEDEGPTVELSSVLNVRKNQSESNNSSNKVKKQKVEMGFQVAKANTSAVTSTIGLGLPELTQLHNGPTSTHVPPQPVKAFKRNKKSKKLKDPLDKNDRERKKTLANIIHKKVIVSNNWKSFVEKQMHLQNNATDEPKKNLYKGTFRKNRIKNTIDAQTCHLGGLNKLQQKPTSIDCNPSAVKEINIQNSNEPEKCNNQNLKKLTRFIGIDCEMVGVDEDGKDNMLARVSLVNKFGECIYDKFVQPKEDVVDYRTHVSGVRQADLKDAESFEIVQKEVAEIIKGRILIGHALRNDLRVLYLSHPRGCIRDTSKYVKFRQINDGRTPSLKLLATKILGVTIQEGEHNSVIDARAAMQLYMLYQKEWEACSKTRRHKSWKSKGKLHVKPTTVKR